MLESPRDTHFPVSEPAETTILTDTCLNSRVIHNIIIDEIFIPEKLTWAINSFKLCKSPDIDAITHITIKITKALISDQLICLYKSCLILGYIPQKWRFYEDIFIPKVGKKLQKATK